MNLVSGKVIYNNRSKLYWLFISLFIILILSCSSDTFNSNSSIDSEASKVATEFWNVQLSKCGDDYYGFNSRYDYTGRIVINQFKGVNSRLVSDKLTQADKLNGIEWKGRTKLSCSSMRTWTDQFGTWSDWRDKNFIASQDFHKVDGQWVGPKYKDRYVPLMETATRYRKVDCSRIPSQ